MPLWATTTQPSPSLTLWAIITRLSILQPRPITVSGPLPRSIVLLAPISTSSPISTRPSCGTLRWPRCAEREAEAVLPDPHARVDHHPLADQAMAEGRAGADHAVRAEPDAGADHRIGADPAARPELGPGLDHRAGRDPAARIEPRRGVDQRAAPRCPRPADAPGPGAAASGCKAAATRA